LLLLLAVWRFMEQRSKATTQAYWSVITLSARSGKIQLGKPPGAESNAGRAGGVVFRKRHGRGEFLLVEAKKDPSQWVLPKGQVEESEHPRETAVREVHEETGQWGRIIDDLGDVSYTLNGRVVTVRFYLMQFMGRGLPVDRDRRHLWLPLKEAVAKASHKETRELIQATERVVSVL
jgi:ADP-ribose pyrophosphatase YjhB (NUDIX family)